MRGLPEFLDRMFDGSTRPVRASVCAGCQAPLQVTVGRTVVTSAGRLCADCARGLRAIRRSRRKDLEPRCWVNSAITFSWSTSTGWC
jgi:hypothetical protein